MAAKWELVTDGDNERTDRLEVSGGHLYRTRAYQIKSDEDENEWTSLRGVSMVFVPDSVEKIMKRMVAMAPQMKDLVEKMVSGGASCPICLGTRLVEDRPCPGCAS